ncbi:MAG TPA: RNA 2',3'-cyclic phosphodiesterase [Oligoflexus sp.]|uniref:RNA 2',3'-cyclic phosphodiesterase n=1 Tax=Oligoflexus sp. TaxID=1971216 RepID=UPI002D7F7DB8|nr:RNA 2',3'-cyclic phosphodiesterase [Oligoflexus sp.]HET9239975.1 RNA 2',3'-cyclic phosphodiesterase [Oligoflexus sp.]
MAFFAIPLPDEGKARINEGLAALRKDWPDVRWVHPEDYHFTLRFLGGLQPEAMTRLLTVVKGGGLPFPPFTLNLQGISSFPPQRDRGVLWIGLNLMPPEMLDLQMRLEQAVQAWGFEAETRPFTPHLTIGRFKNHDAAGIMERLPEFAAQDFGQFTCREYALMKRRYGARDHEARPLYEVLARFPV